MKYGFIRGFSTINGLCTNDLLTGWVVLVLAIAGGGLIGWNTRNLWGLPGVVLVYVAGVMGGYWIAFSRFI